METSVEMNDDTLLLMQPKIHLLSHTFIIFQFNLKKSRCILIAAQGSD